MDISGTITSGNYSGADLSLTGDTVCADGNFCGAKFTTNGFSLTPGGNWRGVVIDGVKQDDWEPPPILFADEEAVQFLSEAFTWGGAPIVAAWNFWVETIHASPLITLSEIHDAFLIWRNGFGPPIDFDFAVNSLEARFGVIAETEEEEWAIMRGIILSKSPAAWRGERVIEVVG